MGGVDLFDQMLTYYPYPHKFKKWWKFFFTYLMEIAIYNSFVIYSQIQSKFFNRRINYLDYRIEIAVSYAKFVKTGVIRQEVQADNEHQHKITLSNLKKSAFIANHSEKIAILLINA